MSIQSMTENAHARDWTLGVETNLSGGGKEYILQSPRDSRGFRLIVAFNMRGHGSLQVSLVAPGGREIGTLSGFPVKELLEGLTTQWGTRRLVWSSREQVADEIMLQLTVGRVVETMRAILESDVGRAQEAVRQTEAALDAFEEGLR